MKKMLAVMVCAAALSLTACGGGTTSSSSGQAAADRSADTFISLLFSDDVTPCTDGIATECDCPGGGTVSASSTVFTFTSCQDSSGNTFTGTITLDTSTNTISESFSTFDECSNVTGSGIPVEASADCAGTISGSCDGESVTCTLVGGSTGEGCDCSF